MDLTTIRLVRRLALVALCSNDTLMERLIFKGGSALELVYRLSSRSSIDMDFSIENDFAPEELQTITELLQSTLESTFREEGYFLFDFEFLHRPKKLRPDAPPFWGGYDVEFKVIDISVAQKCAFDIEQMRKRSLGATLSGGKRFLIEISKCEYCQDTTYGDIDGYKISVYTLRAIMFEKLRAICQQMSEYKHMHGASPRPRDFYDIQKIMQTEIPSKTISPSDIALIEAIFAQKEVPIELLEQIDRYQDFHRQDLSSLLDTLVPEERTTFSFEECYSEVVAFGKKICQCVLQKY